MLVLVLLAIYFDFNLENVITNYTILSFFLSFFLFNSVYVNVTFYLKVYKLLGSLDHVVVIVAFPMDPYNFFFKKIRCRGMFVILDRQLCLSSYQTLPTL